MKINNNSTGNIGKLYQAYQTQAGTKTNSKAAGASSSDTLQLSDQALQIHELIKETRGLPDVREEKIAEIKSQLANNTYNVTPQQIAAAMLKNAKG